MNFLLGLRYFMDYVSVSPLLGNESIQNDLNNKLICVFISKSVSWENNYSITFQWTRKHFKFYL